MCPLYSPNSTNCYTNTEVTRGMIGWRRPAGVHFPLKNMLFSSLEGTKPCISFTKRTLGPHCTPWGRYCLSRSFSNSYYFHTCMPQNHAFPSQNAHFGYIGPPGVSKIIGFPYYFHTWTVQNHAFPWKTCTLLA